MLGKKSIGAMRGVQKALLANDSKKCKEFGPIKKAFN